jgi:threonine dehydrogenase-like Zn-dependent dehydrogenase
MSERVMSERVVVVDGPGRVEIRSEEPEALRDGTFRVQTLYSGVSTGTELSYVKGTNPYLSARFDAGLGLFRPGEPSTPYPVTRLGYMEVARVAESRTPAVAPGDAADAFGTQVRGLGDGVAGRRVAVVGAGAVGLLTALFAQRHGAQDVRVLDETSRRRAVAEALGLATLDPAAGDPAVALKTRWRHGPGDRGADVVFQCRGQASALHLALRLLRPQGTVIDLAFYQAGADEVRLGEEFHHNGLSLRCAQIGRVPRGLATAWDRERLSAETIELLRVYGDVVRKHLVTAVVPFDEAPSLLTALAERRRQEVSVILEC